MSAGEEHGHPVQGHQEPEQVEDESDDAVLPRLLLTQNAHERRDQTQWYQNYDGKCSQHAEGIASPAAEGHRHDQHGNFRHEGVHTQFAVSDSHFLPLRR